MAAKSKHNNGNGPPGSGPALYFEHIERRESGSYIMDVRVLEMIDLYPLYIESLTGHKPDSGQVIEKCVEMTLSADAGFKKFVANRNGKASTAGAKMSAAMPRTEPPSGQRNSKNPDAELSGQRPA